MLTPRKSGVERALLVRDAGGTIRIVATDGPWIAADGDDNDWDAAVIGLVRDTDLPNAGMYLFTGVCEMRPENWEALGATEPHWTGSVRELSMGMLAEFLQMSPPEPPIKQVRAELAELGIDTEPTFRQVTAALRKQKGLAPLTPEEAERAYDAAPAVPLSAERIAEIVEFATSTCPRCEGRGMYYRLPGDPPYPCSVCNGSGRLGPDGAPATT